ncbi:MAG TPA: hypothetical protein VJ843_03945 [Candidatus Saccharimonadales bacterium]|nr:hypothetical protein [Candidatus Saccharimonadales bacterium]
MADFTLNTAANILIAGALALVAYAIGGRLGLFGGKATQHALIWYLPDVVLGCVTIFYLGDFAAYMSQNVKVGFACAVTARFVWRGLIMWRVQRRREGGLGNKAVNLFCIFAVGTLTFKAWQCVAATDADRAGLQGINQILGIVCLGWFIVAILWLVGKSPSKHQ